MGEKDRDAWSTSRKTEEEGRDGRHESWRTGEEDPDGMIREMEKSGDR